MGIGFVLLIWAIVGALLAAATAVVLGTTTFLATRRVHRGRRMAAIFAASVFPFLGLGWAATLFIFQATVNETILHRDPGLGDTWRCPLPNGYSLLMIDDTDNGWVYNPATQVPFGVGEQEDAVGGVAVVQVAGRYILGRSEGKAFHVPTEAAPRADFYFLLDTQAGKYSSFPTYDSLVTTAQPLGIQPKLEPIQAVYSHYRFTWFDIFVAILFVVPPLLAAILLLLWIRRLRRARAVPSVAQNVGFT
ncbi:MAG: hypothetical protein ABSH13_19420 [Candidatus Acidiferrum sp.]